MIAVIKTGGKQYKVAPNDIIRVEKLLGNPGEIIEFKDVLLVEGNGGIHLGTPLLPNTKVAATILDQIRDDKIIVFKKNRRHNYRRKNGHRQYLTVLRITDILPEGAKPSPKKAVSEETAVKTTAPKEAAAPTPAAAAPKKAATPKATKTSAKKAPKK